MSHTAWWVARGLPSPRQGRKNTPEHNRKISDALRGNTNASRNSSSTSYQAGEGHPCWSSDDVTYGGLHDRINSDRGSARLYPCSVCGEVKDDMEWACDLDHPGTFPARSDDPHMPGSPMNLDTSTYLPLCLEHHAAYDLGQGGRRPGCRRGDRQ
jgi:hypothetical protein